MNVADYNCHYYLIKTNHSGTDQSDFSETRRLRCASENFEIDARFSREFQREKRR